jgi:alpha-tubulin suppressor-like RCC1 family protein
LIRVIRDRRSAIVGIAAIASVTIGLPACLGPGDFRCGQDQQCGTNGWCELDGHCSAIDPSCPSRRRFAHAAGAEADACVGTSCDDNPILTLSAGGSHSCLLRRNGGVTCWGRNDDGQLGDGTLTPRSLGVRVAGVSDAVALAAGERHTCAVRKGNTVVCWGADDTGQLGDGGGADQLTPVPVAGVVNATAVAAGAGFSCALLGDETAVCWGDDGDGELGNGAIATTPLPPTPVLGLAGVRSLSAHWQHACAIHDDGTLVCWGNNASGQIGDGTLAVRPQPTLVPGLEKVTVVTTGLSHTCAVTNAGLYCWGSNSLGQLGSDSGDPTVPVTQPVPVPIVSDAIAVAAGAQHTCAVRGSGEVLCWGQNSTGQLGEGSMSSLPAPEPVTGLVSGKLVAAGATFSCAETADGAVFCWGDNHYGQLGMGNGVVEPRPVTVPINAGALSAGGGHTCAVTQASTTAGAAAPAFVCWGSDQAGQLGDNDNIDRATPAPIKMPLLPDTIAAGALHTCAIDLSAGLWCWGRGSSGQLGPGHLLDTAFPVQVPLPSGDSDATEVTAGDAHTCVLVSGGQILCFGDNSTGQLGDGTTTSRPTPAIVALASGPAPPRVASVTAGGGHTCAIDVNGQAWCWGRGDHGQIGDGAMDDHLLPTPIALENGAPARSISAGGMHTCAVDQDGRVFCWGDNNRGQLGTGAIGGNAATPVLVTAVPSAALVEAGGLHTCAELADQTIYCWGANENGQLGDGTTLDSPLPVKVVGATGTVATGAAHTCASTSDANAKDSGTTPEQPPSSTSAGYLSAGDARVTCWGADTGGQLGDGVTLTLSAPELVRVACE